MADGKNLADPKSLADGKNLADPKSWADGKNLADPKSLAEGNNLADLKSLLLVLVGWTASAATGDDILFCGKSLLPLLMVWLLLLASVSTIRHGQDRIELLEKPPAAQHS